MARSPTSTAWRGIRIAAELGGFLDSAQGVNNVRRSGTWRALATIILTPLFARGQETPIPSFPCDKAKTLDEKAICSDARLAELDRLHAEAFLLAKRSNPRKAVRDAREWLDN